MKTQEFVTKRIVKYKQLILAASLFGAALFFYSCENDIEKIQAFSSPEKLPDLTAINFETTYVDSGQVRFLLKAPKLLHFESDGQPYVEFPKGITLKKFDKNKSIISVITADYARQYEKEDKWEAKNNVVAVNAQNDTLKTELLIWEEKAEKIYSDKFVRIIRKDQIINGIGFESDQDMNNWRIKNPKGTIYVDVQKSNKPVSDEPETPLPQDSRRKPVKFQN